MRFVFVVLVALSVAACATVGMPPSGSSAIEFDTTVRLHAHDLTLHLTAGQPRSVPLIVYATGDGGWWGKDKAIFRALETWGYPVAGISSRAYLKHLNDGNRLLRPAQVASDFSAIVTASKTALGLPESTPFVLVGKSRGAGLEVAAASASRFNGRLRGILAVGLTGEEEYVDGATGDAPQVPLRTYQTLPAIGRTRVAVIQSSRDQWVPANEARELLGPDTSSRRLFTVDSRDHNFGGALPTLYRDMERSFDWIMQG
jgi:hypothetical protein